MVSNDPKNLLTRHENLVHSERCKVNSHVQRVTGEWILNTVLIDGYDVPFRYKRKRKYKSLVGANVPMAKKRSNTGLRWKNTAFTLSNEVPDLPLTVFHARMFDV